MRMMRLLSITVSCTATIVALLSTAGAAQQKVPFRGDTPIAPSGIPKIPLPDQPVVYDTAEGQRIRVVVHASGLSHPWSLAFLPRWRTMLVTERDGRLRVIRNGVLDPKAVEGLPTIRRAGLSGLMDVVLHPQFASNNFVYLWYAKPLNEKESATAIARGKWNGTDADRRQRCLRRSGWCWRRRANGVRARRHVVCDDRWWRRQRPSGSE